MTTLKVIELEMMRAEESVLDAILGFRGNAGRAFVLYRDLLERRIQPLLWRLSGGPHEDSGVMKETPPPDGMTREEVFVECVLEATRLYRELFNDIMTQYSEGA